MPAPHAKPRTEVALWKRDEIKEGLLSRVDQIGTLLPALVKEEAERLILRGLLTVTQGKSSGKLATCSKESVIMGIIQAAELGLPVDDKLGYLVPYWNSKKSRNEAQFQPSYLGLTVVAKRSNQILDVFPAMVYQNDVFEHGRQGSKCRLEHNWDFGEPRGEPIGAYCVIELPGSDRWTYELMDLDELEAIKGRTKSRDRDGNIVGPWVSDTEQMFLKTVVKRALKRYCSDPGFILAAQLDDGDYDADSEPLEFGERPKKVSRSSATERFSESQPVQEAVGEPEPNESVVVVDAGSDAVGVENVPDELEKEPDDQPFPVENTVDALASYAQRLGCPDDLCQDWAEHAHKTKTGEAQAFLDTKPWERADAAKKQRPLIPEDEIPF